MGTIQNTDFKGLQKIIGTNPKMLKQFLELFLKTADENLNEIKSAFLVKDIHKISSLSHKLKSSTRLMELNDVFLLLKEIEEITKPGIEPPGLDKKLSLLETELRKIFEAIKLKLTEES